MVVGIIIAVSAGLAILYSVMNASNIAPAIIEPAMAPFIVFVDKGFFFLASALPVLIAVVPLYILRKREAPILAIYGVLFGVGLMAIMIGFGLDVQLLELFQTTWYGSSIVTVGSVLGTFGEALGVLAYGVSLWVWGITLAFVDTAMGGLSLIGDLAYDNRGYIKRKRKEHYKKRGENV